MTRGAKTTLVLLLFAGCGGPPPDAAERVSQDVRVPGADAPGGGDPGAAFFIDSIYLSYISTTRHIRILREQNGQWVSRELAPTTRYGASLCVFDGALYLAWVADDRTLNLMRTFDGENWQDQRTLPSNGVPAYADTPFLVAWDGLNVFANVKRDLKDSRFWAMHDVWSPDGLDWSEDRLEVLDQASPYGPSAAAVENDSNDLVVIWEMPNKKELAVRRFVGGQGWSEIVRQPHLGVPQVAALHVPGVPNNHPLVIVTRGTGNVGHDQIHFFRSDDGSHFLPVGDSPSVTDRKPAIVGADSIGITFDFIGLPRSPGGKALNIETHRF
jgi:hypothetical protein